MHFTCYDRIFFWVETKRLLARII